jgi:ATP-dependent DNA helicase RecQ
VHCVSEWGHDFRFSYLHLGRNLYNYVCTKNQEKHLTLFGLTATASFDVLADVERELSGNGAFPLDSDTIVRYENTNRLELQYKIERVKTPQAINHWNVKEAKNNYIGQYILQIPELLNELQTKKSITNIKQKFIERENLDESINLKEVSSIKDSNIATEMPEQWLNPQSNYLQSGIVFCPHRQGSIGVKDTTKRGIANAIKSDLNCESIGTSLGGNEMSDQDRFINNELAIMVATKAFGMGIDKPNVRFTVNVNHPSSLESFVQEAGRAGRDKKMALATILFSDFVDADKDVQMYFYDNTFKGVMHEKAIMHKLLNKKQINYFTIQDELLEDENRKTNTIYGFLNTLLNAKKNESIVSFIYYYADEAEDIAKAIYRMCCIELIDDFTQDYKNRQFRIVTKRKADGEYYQGLKRFLMRYYSADRAEEEIQKVPHYKGDNEIHKCLGYLTEFIYDKIAVKRKRAIDDMRQFCIEGLNDTKDWKEVNEDLKDFIYYYFNSKYAKDDYVADNGEEFSLTKDTDSGKQSNADIVFKYMRVIDDELVGAGGTPKDNIKHLQGAVRLIRRSLTDTNPALDLLNAFCLFYLGINNNEILENELIENYSNGLLGFKERENNIVEFWQFFDKLNTEIDQRAKDFPNNKFIEIKRFINLEIHSQIIKEITNKYLS